ncbi:MAG TPA: ribosome biogenesis GTPase Der [Nitrospiria bacterium]|nr:ribosome biogenesis GTPase Der [Nitrospiria bacterium]
MKRPIIAIVGRPNVGKSTLFNRILGQRVAIVENIPGVTRDRNYAEATYGGRSFTLVDTGGLDPTEKSRGSILSQVKAQTEQAVAEADILILFYDGREGVTPLDQEIVSLVRRLKKPVFHAVNKIDTPKSEPLAAEFYALGIKTIYPVSAEHGLGLDELMEAVLPLLPPRPETEAPAAEGTGTPRIGVVGRPNVGKSTLINALLGENRLVTDATPGTTRDSIDSRVRFGDKEYSFIDTAGIRRRGKIERGVERYSLARALQVIERCDLAVVVLDAVEGIVEQDTKIIGRVLKARKGCLVLVNKWDLRRNDPKAREKIGTELNRRLAFIPYAPVLYISALKGTPVKEIFERIDTIMTAYGRRIPTGPLNRAFEQAVSANPPPQRQGRPVKLNYITQAEVRPPTFVIFSNRPEQIKEPYLRYLENFLRDSFDFTGTPLTLRIRKKRS